MSDAQFTPEQRIAAARKRLGDLKAVHSRWYDAPNPSREYEQGVIREMEHIAFSVGCYLDGLPGQYLPAASPASTGASP